MKRMRARYLNFAARADYKRERPSLHGSGAAGWCRGALSVIWSGAVDGGCPYRTSHILCSRASIHLTVIKP
jgi:hypothetical protein